MRTLVASSLLVLTMTPTLAAQDPGAFSRADTLRGSDGPGRAWWDATFYDLHVTVQPADSSIFGRNSITYRVLAAGQEMQIDLQQPLVMDSVVLDGRALDIHRDASAVFARLPEAQSVGDLHTVTAYYHGKPRVAVRPPWDGGFSWQQDDLGERWISTSNQGLGASVWWPNKDLSSEEPDSQRIAITVPDPLVNVSNGRLRSRQPNGDGTTTWEWFVASPINNYGISVNAGKYAHWTEEYEGEEGTLTLDYWPLEQHMGDARRQWAQVRLMMGCFEYWFGPYPFYEDGFKLVEAPYLGMEHQSAVTYGNGFQNGYLGTDLSDTGRGLEWDFIIIHESAHEWWANSVTAKDNADLWVHESFANYSENLYTECLTGDPRAGAEYVIGTRSRIANDRPIVGEHGVNDSGSGDKYYKGGNMLHMIRQLVDDDDLWREILRGIGKEFRHQTVSGARIESYITRHSGIELALVFDQYLRTTQVPVLEYERSATTLSYRWTNVVPGFDMAVKVTLAPGELTWIRPTEAWQTVETALDSTSEFRVDENFYVEADDLQDGQGPAG
jgi:aminopeptidase N